MAFVDEVTIEVKAGNGGDGVVRWRREKYIPKGGPSGGDGGNGGSIFAIAVRNVHLLSEYRTKKSYKAQNGAPGGDRSLEGSKGEDLLIPVPVGSIVTNTQTQEKYYLSNEGDKELLLRGGRGGYGNEHFKSSTNVTPQESTKGTKGEEGEFFIEVELTADIGLIGLPSAGKTSLLNVLTAANAKVGAYPFTTLEPNLGECFGYIISDIPGLIEGAHHGKGLGHKFLRHVKRTRILVHLVSLEYENPLEEYETIRNELREFDEELIEKEEIVLLTKTDLVDEETIQKTKALFQKQGKEVYTVSVFDDDSVKTLRTKLLEKVQ